MTTETTQLTIQSFAEVVRGFFDNETPIDVRKRYQSILYEWECSPDAWKVASQCIRLFGSGPFSEVTLYAAQLLLSQTRGAKGNVPLDFYQEILNLLKCTGCYEECRSVRLFLCEALAFCIVGQNLPNGTLHDLEKEVGSLCCLQIMGRVPHAQAFLSDSLDPEIITAPCAKFDFDSWGIAVFGGLVSRLGEFDNARLLGDVVDPNVLQSILMTGQAWITSSGLYAIDIDIASTYFRFCGVYWDNVESANCVIEALDCCPEGLIPMLYQTILAVLRHLSASYGLDARDGYQEVLYRWKYAFVIFCTLNPKYCMLDTSDSAVLRQGLLTFLVQEWYGEDLIDEYTSLDAEIFDAIAQLTNPDKVDVSEIAIIHEFSEQFVKQGFFQSVSERQALFSDCQSLQEIFESEFYRIWTVESAEAVSNAMSFVSPSVFLESLVKEIRNFMSVQPFSPTWGTLHGCIFFLRSVLSLEKSSAVISEPLLSVLDQCIDVCYKILGEGGVHRGQAFFMCSLMTLLSDKQMVKKLYAFCDGFNRKMLEEFVIKHLQFAHLLLFNNHQLSNEENIHYLKQVTAESSESSVLGIVGIRYTFENIYESNSQIFRDFIQVACSSLFTREEFSLPLIRLIPLLKVYSFTYEMFETYQYITEIVERAFIAPIMDFLECMDKVSVVSSETAISAVHIYLTTLNTLCKTIDSRYHEKCDKSSSLERLLHGWLRFAGLIATTPGRVQKETALKINDSILVYIQLNPNIDPRAIEGIFNKSMHVILAAHDFSESFAVFLCDYTKVVLQSNQLNWNIVEHGILSYLESVHQHMEMGIELNLHQTLSALLIGKMYFALCIEKPSNVSFSVHAKYILDDLHLIFRCLRNASSHVARTSLSAFVSTVNLMNLSLANGSTSQPEKITIEHEIGPWLMINLYGTIRAHVLLSSGSFLPNLPKFLSLVTKMAGIAFQVSSHQDIKRAHWSLIIETWSSQASSFLEKPLGQALAAIEWNLVLSLWTHPDEAALKRSVMRQLRLAANRMTSL